MKTKQFWLQYFPMGLSGVLIVTLGIVFEQPFYKMLPMLNTLVVMLLSANANRYTFLFGVRNVMSVSSLVLDNGDLAFYFLIKENDHASTLGRAVSSDGVNFVAERCVCDVPRAAIAIPPSSVRTTVIFWLPIAAETVRTAVAFAAWESQRSKFPRLKYEIVVIFLNIFKKLLTKRKESVII